MKLTIRDIGYDNKDYVIFPIEVLPTVNNDNVVSLYVYFDKGEYVKAINAIPAKIIEREYEELNGIHLSIPKRYKVMIS